MSQIPVATDVDVVLRPAAALPPKLLKDFQGLLPAAVIAELTTIAELLPRLQLFSGGQPLSSKPVWQGP